LWVMIYFARGDKEGHIFEHSSKSY
jgi:hypothetical protein